MSDESLEMRGVSPADLSDQSGWAEEALDIPVEPEQTTPVDTRIIALTGACGGAGTTTIAIQMAHEKSQANHNKGVRKPSRERPKVCLLDLDFEGGGLANAIDVPTDLEIEDLVQSEAKIDEVFVTAVTRVHHSGFAIIASAGEFGGNERVNPNAVLTLLDIVSSQYETVIIDLPTSKTDWTIPALMGADHRAIVTPLTVAGLRRTALKLQSIDPLFGTDLQADIILNKAERRTLRASLNERDARKALGRDALGAICLDFDLTNTAMNTGEPCGVIRREARFVKDVRDILKSWESQTVEALEQVTD